MNKQEILNIIKQLKESYIEHVTKGYTTLGKNIREEMEVWELRLKEYEN